MFSRLRVKYSLFFSYFNQTRISEVFSKNPQYQISRKSTHREPSVSMRKDGRIWQR